MSPVPVFSNPFWLGFDELEALLERTGRGVNDGFPPYNVEKHTTADGGVELRIVLAVAGFSADDLEVLEDGAELVVRGKNSPDDKGEFLHRGIAGRQFQRLFVLADGLKVASARLANGLLTITVERPGRRQARRVAIET